MIRQRKGAKNAGRLIRADNHWPEDGSPLHFKATHLRGLALAGRLDARCGRNAGVHPGRQRRAPPDGAIPGWRRNTMSASRANCCRGLELLRHGLSLDKVKLLRAQVSWLSEQQLRFVLHENRKRQIQRMCELVVCRRPTSSASVSAAYRSASCLPGNGATCARTSASDLSGKPPPPQLAG
jgi:23S rRNA pseudouridine2604 synthase